MPVNTAAINVITNITAAPAAPLTNISLAAAYPSLPQVINTYR